MKHRLLIAGLVLALLFLAGIGLVLKLRRAVASRVRPARVDRVAAQRSV